MGLQIQQKLSSLGRFSLATPQAGQAPRRTRQRRDTDAPTQRRRGRPDPRRHRARPRDLFEARYGDQIHRHHEDRSAHNIVSTESTHRIDDPPF